MAGLTGRRRLLLAAAYVGFLVFAVGALVVLQMAYNQQAHAAIKVPVLLFHALPILVVKFFQDLAFGGPDGGGGGYAALVYFGTVLLQWWPLLAVAVVPRLWVSRAGRVAVKVYFVALAVLMIGAGVWLALDPSLLAS
ncbi:MAG TPA: hypothetical protein VM238_16025 [Phycisphaerae bacterium]|nr:hypothetical protein [Phycisphaerae bacterium]